MPTINNHMVGGRIKRLWWSTQSLANTASLLLPTYNSITKLWIVMNMSITRSYQSFCYRCCWYLKSFKSNYNRPTIAIVNVQLGPSPRLQMQNTSHAEPKLSNRCLDNCLFLFPLVVCSSSMICWSAVSSQQLLHEQSLSFSTFPSVYSLSVSLGIFCKPNWNLHKIVTCIFCPLLNQTKFVIDFKAFGGFCLWC